jgi:transcriptional regulator with XRE-family HTH domain
MIDPFAVAERLKSIVEASGLTQRELAEALGISQPAVSQYLRGRMPQADVLYRLAKLGNCSMEWLLTGEQPRAQHDEVNEPAPPYGAAGKMLRIWEKLSPESQQVVLVVMDELLRLNIAAGAKNG